MSKTFPLPAAAAGSLLLFAACGTDAPKPSPTSSPTPSTVEAPLQFVDVAAASGVDFRHRSGAAGELLMYEILGAGVATFDCDDDGDPDLLLRQSDAGAGGKETDRLYRNDTPVGGPWRFVDVTAGSGLDVPAYGMGVAAGDYDDDGRIDLYLTNYGSNRLLRARGDCRYEDRTLAAGAGDERWSSAATFFDADRDGDLDLYVGNYLAYSRANHKTCYQASGAPDYCGPDAYGALPPRLLENRGDGTFADITSASGLGRESGKTLGAIAADFDADGWPDLFVANDSTDNHLWINRGDGTFEERAKLLGAALNAAGLRTGDMGVDAADFDADGDLDLLSTHLSVEGISLFRNDGKGGFWDSAAATGSLAATLGLTGFGARWFDPDLDSDLDLFLANGGVRFIDRLARLGPSRTLEQPNLLLRFADGRYRAVGAEAGDAIVAEAVNRGVAVADFDGDGDPDLVVSRNDGPPQLLENRQPAGPAWLGLRLVERTGKRDALGAIARLELADGSFLVRRVQSDGSYLSASDPRILFGLAGRARPLHLDISWPDGTRERFPPPPTGAYATLRQGTGAPLETARP